MNLPEPFGQAATAFFQKLLGPVGEAGDFLTDKIRFYRWQSSLKTLKRAKEIAEKNKISPKEVPLKFLIPFMEKSSLEGEDDNLIEKWAQLLTSATIDERDAKPIYVDILSGLTGDDIKALDEFLPPKFYENMKEMKEKIKTLARGEISSSELITTLNASNRDTLTRDAVAIAEEVRSSGATHVEGYKLAHEKFHELAKVACGGSEYESIAFDNEDMMDEGGEEYVFAVNARIYSKIESYEILASRGLIYRSAHHFVLPRTHVNIVILSPSPLGVEFVRACRGVPS